MAGPHSSSGSCGAPVPALSPPPLAGLDPFPSGDLPGTGCASNNPLPAQLSRELTCSLTPGLSSWHLWTYAGACTPVNEGNLPQRTPQRPVAHPPPESEAQDVAHTGCVCCDTYGSSPRLNKCKAGGGGRSPEINHPGPTYQEKTSHPVTRLAASCVLEAETQIKGSRSSEKGVEPSSWRKGAGI